MFKYSRAAIDLIIKDLKRIYRTFKIISFLVMFSYFVFASIVGLGIRWVNIALAAVLLVYQIIDFFVSSKRVKKYARRGYVWIKLTIRAISLGIIIYGIYETAENATPLSIILVTLMIIFWIGQLIFEIILEIFENKRDLFLEAVKADFDNYKQIYEKPINTVKKVVSFIKGEKPTETDVIDIEEKKESKNIKRLNDYLHNKHNDKD